MTGRLAALAAVIAAAALAGCGGNAGTPATATHSHPAAAETTGGGDQPAVVETTGDGDQAAGATGFKGGTVSPVRAAPEIGLSTWDRRPVRVADYRGDVMLVTFVYVNCPDVCPLIVDNLLRVKRKLGAEGKQLRIVAVSVDAKGDTPRAVRAFLQRHQALGKVDYAVGSQAELEPVWAAWGVGARADPTNPELVEHSGVIWGVDPRGRRVTFYPATGFSAADIASDVRVMLAG